MQVIAMKKTFHKKFILLNKLNEIGLLKQNDERF